MSDLPKPLPFVVEIHDRMFVRVAGKRPNTVLTIEQMLYTWRICEYTDPLSYGRSWCYETVGEAMLGLATYMAIAVAVEPQGWIRAVDFGDDLSLPRGAEARGDAPHDLVRVRHAHVEFGERVISIDGDLDAAQT